jgi:putative spermidine/putrescine transport system ATP-binding protein
VAQLVLEGVQKTFRGGFTALHGLDLDVRSGEFLSLLGPSGCGKTTALRIVAGFDFPTAGRILLDGQDVSGIAVNRREMGMVFQAYSLFPNMTARANVEFGLRVRRKPSRRERAQELLELVGLGDAGDRYPHQLSGGMQQRVALARALAIEPRVLLLDEPLSALDAKVRVQLREEIRRIQQRLGITTLYVTHDQEEALAISDRICVLSQGRIEQLAPPADIYGAPATPFVAEFVGTMNRIPAVVAESSTGLVEFGGRRMPIDAARELPQGTNVLVLVRPEQLKITAPGGPAEPGMLEGTIASQTFLGADTRLVVSVGELELRADVPSPAAAAVPVGASVRAQIAHDAAQVLQLNG